MVSGEKELLRGAMGTPIKLPGTHPKYKEAYSESVWMTIRRTLENQDRLEKQVAALQDTLKLVVNQSQLAISLVKQVAQTAKALPRPEQPDNDEDVDLKGQ